MMAAFKQTVTRSIPIVVVLGATGTGKSKLAIHLCKNFDGEVISADSMQVYRGLDIVTNKVTAEEQEECPHHLLDYVSPLHTQYTVVDYQKAALPMIDRLLECDKLPVIVGGTNYYIESLLWNYLLTDPQPQDGNLSVAAEFCEGGNDVLTVTDDVLSEDEPSDTSSDEEARDNKDFLLETKKSSGDQDAECKSLHNDGKSSTRKIYSKCNTATLYSRLYDVDPTTARRLHPNNRRKILRALEVYSQYGLTASHLYQTQHGCEAGQAISGPLRYQNLCVIWIQCQQEVLDERLDARVDDMISRGLIQELEDFHKCYDADRITKHSKIDYQLGIFQNIGFKEFHDYLILPQEEKSSDKGLELLSKGLEDMKRVTRKYAKKQVRWIRNRFLRRPGSSNCPVYGLDGTDITKWEVNVSTPAMEIVSALTQKQIPAQEPLLLEPKGKNPAVHNVCEVCEKVFVTLIDWEIHMKSKRHRNAVMKKRKEELGLFNNERIQDHPSQKSSVT